MGSDGVDPPRRARRPHSLRSPFLHPSFTRPARLRLDQQRAHGEANLAINPLGPVGEAEVPAVEFAPARRISTVCGSATTMWATQPKSLMPAMRTMAPTRRGSATAAWASTLRRPSPGCSCSQPQRVEQPVVEPPPRAGRRLHPDGDLGDRSVRPRRSLDHDGHPAEGNVDDSPGQVACSEAPLCRGTTTHAPRASTAARVGQNRGRRSWPTSRRLRWRSHGAVPVGVREEPSAAAAALDGEPHPLVPRTIATPGLMPTTMTQRDMRRAAPPRGGGRGQPGTREVPRPGTGAVGGVGWVESGQRLGCGASRQPSHAVANGPYFRRAGGR
jgi:hypothetical protein